MCMCIFVSQKMEAAYYDNIIEQQRIEPEFFKMGFYGKKFPFFLRVRSFSLIHWLIHCFISAGNLFDNKSFIYEKNNVGDS